MTVYSNELVDFFKDSDGHTRAVIDVYCSKGTYIRSICNDIGDMLGSGAAMSSLVRTSSGRRSIVLPNLESVFTIDSFFFFSLLPL